jgi:DNA-binding XRE family transcriptional regulator
MTWIKQYAEKRSAKDPEFKTAYEVEEALLELVRARQRANLTQQDLAATLHVSQPYIAQIERGTKPISLSFMVRYANAVGATIQITPSSPGITAHLPIS